MNTIFHQPVLLAESVDYLNVTKGRRYIDATLGGGGHTWEILKRGGLVLGLDVDEAAITYCQERFGQEENLVVKQGNFAKIADIAGSAGFDQVEGILFDLGLSSHQLGAAERGFSFAKDGPLDMRADLSLGVKAADLVGVLSKKELYELFQNYGQDPNSWRVANYIVSQRRIEQIISTRQLAGIIETATGKTRRKIHPATRIFQALRIAVNDEIGNLKLGLSGAMAVLKKDGKLVVVSYHSLEDRVVKDFFKSQKNLRIVNEKPILPTREEIEINPRSRSAKMRVAEKIMMNDE
ncbi:16S rRNA (cytosine(1402)-N(4))-methyltransferase RsmH [Candidatus Daviesbacteria bacterium]|nr:16S rRNA (cytosine(1402)-N(4))-methyltransferase RsmH [Candidatus Daviesbacteria bacterium]